jgi:hypothetical protein
VLFERRGAARNFRLSLIAASAALAGTALAAPAAKPAAAKKPVAAAKRPLAPAYPAGLRVDTAQRRVELVATVAKREHDDVLKGAIEYFLVSKGGKAYESVFETDVKADALDRALKQVGLKPGAPPAAQGAAPTGPGVQIEVLLKGENGAEKTLRAGELVLDVVEAKALSDLSWTYTGSRMMEDPATGKRVLMAAQTNNLVSTHREDATVLLMNPLPTASGNRYKRNETALPKAGTKVRLVFRPAR